MHRSIPTLVYVFFLSFCINAGAVEIELGDRSIEVPLPDGYVVLTPEMSPYYESIQAYIAPSNIRFMTLVPADTAAAMLRGEDVILERYMNVESEKRISSASVSTELFDELQDVLRTQADEIYADIENQLPDIVTDGNKTMSEELSVDVAVELGGMVPLPVHLDTDRAIANSMFMTVGVTVDNTEAQAEVLSATNLTLHVKDKVLFLYVYGSESALEWTRETATNWSNNILAANPLSDGERQSVEQADSSAFDWGQVAEKALIGALVGGIIGFFSFLRKRKTKK